MISKEVSRKIRDILKSDFKRKSNTFDDTIYWLLEHYKQNKNSIKKFKITKFSYVHKRPHVVDMKLTSFVNDKINALIGEMGTTGSEVIYNLMLHYVVVKRELGQYI